MRSQWRPSRIPRYEKGTCLYRGKTSTDSIQLTVPNANIGQPQPNVSCVMPEWRRPRTTLTLTQDTRTSHDQEVHEYKEKQDITAPPDPIAEGTTSDVPIRGEKTNVLFHPTPSISFKPMFEQLEKRAIGLCIAIPAAIIFLGRFVGGSLLGLIPLAACITSGVWLWMHEVIRRGKEMEWSSEQLRGETVRKARSVMPMASSLTSVTRPLQTCSPSPWSG